MELNENQAPYRAFVGEEGGQGASSLPFSASCSFERAPQGDRIHNVLSTSKFT